MSRPEERERPVLLWGALLLLSTLVVVTCILGLVYLVEIVREAM